jgi:DNA-directed RNA polymerase specialized sigma24 family protein
VSVAAPQVLVDRLDAARQQPEPALPGWGSFELDEALARVAPIHGRVLVLFYRDDLNTEEVAAAVGRTPKAVDKLRRRALAAVRSQLVTARAERPGVANAPH